MSDVINPSPSAASRSGARAYAGLGARTSEPVAPTRPMPGNPPPRSEAPPRQPPLGEAAPARPVEAVPVETVTLNKLGEFLELDFGRLFSWIGRGMALIVVLAILGAIAGGLYGVFGEPRYTVGTDLMIDPAGMQVIDNDLYQQPGQADAALLSAASKLRVLTSGNVLLRVVDDLNLTADVEFYDPAPGFSITRLLGIAGQQAEPNPRYAALAALTKKVSTRADESSFVATLLVSSRAPEKSVRIADAIVAAFRTELATADAAGASRTADSLNQRLDELRADVRLAEDRVEAFKRSNNLAAGSSGLVSTQNMTQLNAQLVDAEARVIAAESVYNQLLADGGGIAGADNQNSAAVAGARARVAELRSQYDSQSTIYGPRHPTLVRLRAELDVAQSQLDTEMARVVAAAKISLDEARAGLAALTSRAETLRSEVFTDNESLVALRELERDAANKAAVYEAFLLRAKQTAERVQIDATNVRVISPPVPPPDRSWPPRTVIMIAAGGVGGVALGMLIAVLLGIARDLRRPARRPETALAT